MRVVNGRPTGSAVAAARSIAQISWRVDMALELPSFSTVKVAGFGKVRVNRIVEPSF